MRQTINNWLKNNQLLNFNVFKNALFKQKCLLCDAPEAANIQTSGHALCRACLNDLPWHPTSSCPQCGLASDGNVCGSCISSPPDFDATQAVFLYAYPIDTMMQRYKYGSMLNLSQTFGQLLSDKILLESVDVVIPMPMHPARIKERGFNQAHEIAKVLTKNHAEKLDYKSVIRQKLTPPQASLPLKERVKNIKGAFKVNSDLSGKRVAIVDDVMTTGASLNELAKTFKKAGASHVECWVIARTLLH
ncbi:MAG TPA: ComF family protein [Methylotenera sp.]|nr:ComF family protein [Methylotenera sp.]HPV44888.1 ComF family protein [Methylotenera sp.]